MIATLPSNKWLIKRNHLVELEVFFTVAHTDLSDPLPEFNLVIRFRLPSSREEVIV
jgi:hypothetical protein